MRAIITVILIDRSVGVRKFTIKQNISDTWKILALFDKTAEVRHLLLTLLSKACTESSKPLLYRDPDLFMLIKALKNDGNDEVRHMIPIPIKKIFSEKPETYPALLEAAEKDKAPIVRISAINMLALYKFAKLRRQFATILKNDDDFEVRK